MTKQNTGHMVSYVRFLLILTGLIMLNFNTPVQSSSDISLNADFTFIQQSGPGIFQLGRILVATVSAKASIYQSDLLSRLQKAGLLKESDKDGRSFRIVSVSSRHAASKQNWPVKGAISSGFGMRRHPVTRRNSFHNGIDIKARQGTSINSPAEGVVVSAGRAGLMGRMVKVKTGTGKILYFGHLHKIKCKKGDQIKRGQLLGTVGSSGRATGPHLHFSVVSAGRFINPLKYLSAD